MSMTYYFISDLHIGGDEALGVCDFEEELIGFLETLAARQEEAELFIIGDISVCGNSPTSRVWRSLINSSNSSPRFFMPCDTPGRP